MAERPDFGGTPGTPVAAVDPEDLKAIWRPDALMKRGTYAGDGLSTLHLHFWRNIVWFLRFANAIV
jgi:hypothetical protein